MSDEDDDAAAWVDYNAAVYGRLRLDLLHGRLLQLDLGRGARILDVGCGTGETSILMARRGGEVTMLDHSEAMLARATARAQADGVSSAAIRADASELGDLDLDSFTLIVCHNVLAYVPDGASVVAAMANLVRPGGHLSLVVSNRIAEPISYVLERRDLSEAIRWAVDPPRIRQGHTFARPMRLHDQEELSEWFHSAGLGVETIAGLNIVAPYLPDDFKESHYRELVQLEETLGRQPHYARIAMHLHLIQDTTKPDRLPALTATPSRRSRRPFPGSSHVGVRRGCAVRAGGCVLAGDLVALQFVETAKRLPLEQPSPTPGFDPVGYGGECDAVRIEDPEKGVEVWD